MAGIWQEPLLLLCGQRRISASAADPRRVPLYLRSKCDEAKPSDAFDALLRPLRSTVLQNDFLLRQPLSLRFLDVLYLPFSRPMVQGMGFIWLGGGNVPAIRKVFCHETRLFLTAQLCRSFFVFPCGVFFFPPASDLTNDDGSPGDPCSTAASTTWAAASREILGRRRALVARCLRSSLLRQISPRMSRCRISQH